MNGSPAQDGCRLLTARQRDGQPSAGFYNPRMGLVADDAGGVDDVECVVDVPTAQAQTSNPHDAAPWTHHSTDPTCGLIGEHATIVKHTVNGLATTYSGRNSIPAPTMPSGFLGLRG